MLRKRKGRMAALIVGLIIPLLAGMATPAFARSVSLKDPGFTLWIFIVIGAAIVLLQLIPAAILFFSFVGTSSSMVFKRKKGVGEVAGGEKAILPAIEPAPVKK
jgi:hypothetical protein